jgi:PrtD family type I secretion system ABC transporter
MKHAPMTTMPTQLLRRPLLHAAALSFGVNLLLLAPALFMLQVFDRVLASQSADTLLVLLLGVGLALALMGVLDHLRSRLQGVAGNLLGDALAPVVARLMVAQGARRGARGDTEGLRDVGALRSLFSSQGLLALFDAPWVPVYIAAIWLAHPWLGIAAALGALTMLALALLTDRLTRRGIDELVTTSAAATRDLEAALANAEVAQALGMTDALLARWRGRMAEVQAQQAPMARRSVALAALTRALRQALQVALLALGAALVIAGEASAGVMIATSTLLGRALAPVEQAVGSWRVLSEAAGAWRRVAALLAQAQAEPDRMALPAPRGELVAQQLVFRAPKGEQPILAGVSLALAAGESLAIVGASGAGKSTLVRLLTGLWRPLAGSVRLDGADLALWPRDALGPQLGYMPQDVQLFAGSVAENIARMGEVDADAVVAAAQLARCHQMVLALPDGYDTRIEPASALLSPGQRQRIALARALYRQPKLVVLDEPNANLDGAGEQALAETLAELRGQATVVVVTHRRTLLAHVDKLLVLDAGRVQHFGSVAEVEKALQQQLPAKPQRAQVVPMARGAQGALA